MKLFDIKKGKHLLKLTMLPALYFVGFSAHASSEQLESKLVEKINQYLTTDVTAEFSGTLLVAKNGKVLHAKGYGFAG